MGTIFNRRQFLKSSSLMAGALSLSPLSFAQAKPHFTPKAKRLVFIMMSGGVSQVDTFDPKEALTRDDAKTINHRRNSKKTKVLTRSHFTHKPYGQSGIKMTNIFENIGGLIDDCTVVRSMVSEHSNHFEAMLGMHTGSFTVPRPGIGAWLSYGLGSMNHNIPNHVVLSSYMTYAGEQNWDSHMLPAIHQGMHIMPGDDPIRHIKSPVKDMQLQNLEMDLLNKINKQHHHTRPSRSELDSRNKNYKMARTLMSEAPELFDLRRESQEVMDLYGVKRGDNSSFAWQCLMTRRLLEKDCRVIELVHRGADKNWDSHADMKDHVTYGKEFDKPVAALITDLKRRGLLDDTLVVLTTEFGRSPYADKKDHKGRGHHADAFSIVMAGGGVKGGHVHGETDEHGINVVDKKVSVYDLHATILDLMGLNHEELVFYHEGRNFRLTDVFGNVVTDIIK